MTVSVVIPFYNQAEYIQETVEGVLAQTYQDFEIVIVNDASPQKLPREINRHANRHKGKIKVVRNLTNCGIAASRNIGVANSRGEFILPLDSDDNILPTFLERTIAEMNEGVGVVSTWFYMEPDTTSQQLGHTWQMLGPHDSSYPVFSPTREEILKGNSLPICSLIRRQTFKEVGGYAEDFPKGFEDWCLWASIVCSGNWRVKVIEDYLFRYRVHQKSVSHGGGIVTFGQAWTLLQERFKQAEK